MKRLLSFLLTGITLFTKLGHIDNITQNELKSILGDGNVSVTFSLK